MSRTGWGPVSIWRIARQHCQPACFGYHAAWPLVRGAGLKASPRWHTAFYRHELSQAGLLAGDQPVRALVAGAADHTTLTVLAELIGPQRLTTTVVDQCQTPLTVIRHWATANNVSVSTQQGRIEQLPPAAERYDLVITDGLLSLLPDPTSRTAALSWIATALGRHGTLLYTTRLTCGDRALEYNLIGRLLQTGAALTWPGQHPNRWQLAAQRWRHPARTAAYRTTEDLHADLASHFTDIHLALDTAPPTLAQRVHPRRWCGTASVLVRTRATSTKARPA